MIEWIALVIAVVALGLNVLLVGRIGKVIQHTGAAEEAFKLLANDAKEAKKLVDEAKYWRDKFKEGNHAE